MKVFLNPEEEKDIDGRPVDDVELANAVRTILKEKNYKISYEQGYEELLKREALEKGEDMDGNKIDDIDLAKKLNKICFQEDVTVEEAYSLMEERDEL